MTSNSGIERRVSRLENDRDALYELVVGIRTGLDDLTTETRARFDAMDGRLDTMDGRLDDLGTTLAEVVRRLPEPS